jgi:hypothetical protein
MGTHPPFAGSWKIEVTPSDAEIAGDGLDGRKIGTMAQIDRPRYGLEHGAVAGRDRETECDYAAAPVPLKSLPGLY